MTPPKQQMMKSSMRKREGAMRAESTETLPEDNDGSPFLNDLDQLLPGDQTPYPAAELATGITDDPQDPIRDAPEGHQGIFEGQSFSDMVQETEDPANEKAETTIDASWRDRETRQLALATAAGLVPSESTATAEQVVSQAKIIEAYLNGGVLVVE